MKRINRITESDLKRLVKKVLNEDPMNVMSLPEFEVSPKSSGDRELKMECEKTIEVLENIIDTLNNPCESNNISDTIKRDLSFQENKEDAIDMLDNLSEKIYNPLGI